jgi:hypothetical protein
VPATQPHSHIQPHLQGVERGDAARQSLLQVGVLRLVEGATSTRGAVQLVNLSGGWDDGLTAEGAAGLEAASEEGDKQDLAA